MKTLSSESDYQYNFWVSALVIFAVNVKNVANFYESILGLSRSAKPGDSKQDIRLCSDQDEILIHSIPTHIAKTISLTSPPVPREEMAMKPVFEVGSLSNALAQVPLLGGVVTDRTFTSDGVTRHDIIDPEGNVIQIRSRLQI